MCQNITFEPVILKNFLYTACSYKFFQSGEFLPILESWLEFNHTYTCLQQY